MRAMLTLYDKRFLLRATISFLQSPRALFFARCRHAMPLFLRFAFMLVFLILSLLMPGFHATALIIAADVARCFHCITP